MDAFWYRIFEINNVICFVSAVVVPEAIVKACTF